MNIHTFRLALNVEANSVKFLEEYLKELYRPKFLNCDVINIKNCLFLKTLLKKRKATDRKNIFTIQLSNKVILVGLC